MICQTVIIWDSMGVPPESEGVVYLWRGYAERAGVRSILRYIEAHADRLRRKFLAWVHDLGQSRINGRRLIDHLVFKGDDLSYWWMTLLVEKSPYKSPITEAIRLLALEEIIIKEKPTRVILFSANRSLHETILGLCQSLGIEYQWKRLPIKFGRFSLKSIYYRLPLSVRALISLLKHLWLRWPLRGRIRKGWFEGEKSLFFCSYFIHLDKASCSKGRFYSHQWEVLPKFLHSKGFRINWIHHYINSSTVPNTAAGLDWVKRFNQNAEMEGFHIFLDTFLCWRVVFTALRRWFWLYRLSLCLHPIRAAFRPKNSYLSFWPVMRTDWYNSLRGPVAIRNLLWIELFDAAMQELPHQRMGLYLCENQSWERALIHAWRKHGHGHLIAVAHSTVRFWDLRYFADPRTIRGAGSHSLPQPNIIALNGKAALDAYKSADYPKDNIAGCEALRYMYLSDLNVVRSSLPENPKILILGDVMALSTKKLLKLLEASKPLLPEIFTYTVKPHPNYMVKAEDFPSLNLKIVTEPLEKIIREYDIAFASNTTSAAVDAYLAGLYVVVMLDDNELNFSPLRGHPGVRFVSTPEELSKAFEAGRQNAVYSTPRNDFFFLDPKLPRWRRLLGF